MSNFELIDDYLTNRLGAQDKAAFEQRLMSDPALLADMDFQKHVLEGVKKARAAELKAMLKNVPVGGGLSSGLTAGKIAAGVVAAGIVATSLYLYLKQPVATQDNLSTITPKNQIVPADSASKAPEGTPTEQPNTLTKPPVTVEPQKAKPKALKKKESAKSKVTPQPKIDVVDPSDELVDNSSKTVPAADGQKSMLTTSHIAVETNTSDKKYNFHYQFSSGKLVLYGPFDKSLYEILEIHGDQHAVFLFYKENYYLLDEKQNKVAELLPIKNPTLLRKLKEYRGR